MSGPLRIEGRWFVDAHGRVVLLHGVNNVDKTPPYVEPGDGFTVTAEDAALLAGHGFNTVRLGIAFDGLMPIPGDVDEAYLDRVAGVVEVLGDAGIHVLLDNHQDGLSPVWGGNGFPAWSIRSRPLPGEPNPGFPLYYLMPSMNLGWDEVWNDTYGVVGHLGDALAALAGRLRDHPAVLGLELMNEPWPGTATPTCFPAGCPLFDAQFQGVWERVTDRIREAAPELNVFWEPNVTWNETMPTHLAAPPLTPALRHAGIAFSFHDYCGFSQAGIYLGLGEQVQDACPLQHDKTWTNADTFEARTGIPALVTEFGDVDASVIAATMERADARMVGWHWWHYASEFGTEAGEDPFVGTDFGRQLVRTYPQATAGTPREMSFDAATGAFAFSYATGPATAPTQIYVSDLHYPHGYTVALEGACALSAPGERLLVLRHLDNVPDVHVALSAGTGTWPACAHREPDADADPPTSTAAGGDSSDERAGSLPATGGSTRWPTIAIAIVTALLLRRLGKRPRTPPILTE